MIGLGRLKIVRLRLELSWSGGYWRMVRIRLHVSPISPRLCQYAQLPSLRPSWRHPSPPIKTAPQPDRKNPRHPDNRNSAITKPSAGPAGTGPKFPVTYEPGLNGQISNRKGQFRKLGKWQFYPECIYELTAEYSPSRGWFGYYIQASNQHLAVESRHVWVQSRAIKNRSATCLATSDARAHETERTQKNLPSSPRSLFFSSF